MPMPRLIRFSASEIAMYFADHNPPHFHILGRDGAAQVRIDTLEIIQMSGKLELREALVWAEQNRTFLEMKWTEFSGEQL